MTGFGIATCRRVAVAALLTSIAALASAQPASAPASGAGMGMGKGRGMGMKMDAGNTPGWSMMSRAERDEHHSKMLGMKSMDECKAYMDQHHAAMADRAKSRNKKMAGPRRDACAMMMGSGTAK
jgi:hypothetical protein